MLPGLWVYFLVLPGQIPTENLGKLPPPPALHCKVYIRDLEVTAMTVYLTQIVDVVGGYVKDIVCGGKMDTSYKMNAVIIPGVGTKI